jgi:hypothetical protein
MFRAALVAQHAAEAAAQLAVDLSQAQYTQAGTGAVADKFADFDKRLPVPEQFGAKSDGTTDDALAIQKCLNALGCCFLSPSKIYWFKSGVILPDNAVLGSITGRSKIVLHSSVAGTGVTMIEMHGGNVKLRGLTIDATGANLGIWVTTNGVQSIQDVDCYGAGGRCLKIDGRENFTNPDFSQSPPMTGWTLGGSAAYNSGFAGLSAAGDYIQQQCTNLRATLQRCSLVPPVQLSAILARRREAPTFSTAGCSPESTGAGLLARASFGQRLLTRPRLTFAFDEPIVLAALCWSARSPVRSLVLVRPSVGSATATLCSMLVISTQSSCRLSSPQSLAIDGSLI